MDEPIGTILATRQIRALKDGLDAKKTALSAKLSKTLPDAYQPSEAYVKAILGIFYRLDLPTEEPLDPPRTELSAADRERCIIALLAARGARFNLALHVYIALMMGISADEIANILLLAGVYTGVDTFAESLKVATQALTILRDGGTTDPEAIFSAFEAVWPA